MEKTKPLSIEVKHGYGINSVVVEFSAIALFQVGMQVQAIKHVEDFLTASGATGEAHAVNQVERFFNNILTAAGLAPEQVSNIFEDEAEQAACIRQTRE